MASELLPTTRMFNFLNPCWIFASKGNRISMAGQTRGET